MLLATYNYKSLLEHQGLQSDSSMHAVDEKVFMDSFPAFFPGARLNFAENILDQGRRGIAVKAFSEAYAEGKCDAISWVELRKRVKAAADALYGSGIRQNDVIACE